MLRQDGFRDHLSLKKVRVALIGPTNDGHTCLITENIYILTVTPITSIILGCLGSMAPPSDPSSDLPSDFVTVGQAILDLPTVEITGI